MKDSCGGRIAKADKVLKVTCMVDNKLSLVIEFDRTVGAIKSSAMDWTLDSTDLGEMMRMKATPVYAKWPRRLHRRCSFHAL
jgi:hypothetical protein